MKYYFYLISFLGCIFLSSCNEAISFCDINSASESVFKMRSQSYAISYSVNESLMQRYINLTAPNKEVEGITPIIRNTNDTLAYIVQYSQGWEIVSGDIRMTPRLAYAETGEFSMSDYLGNGAGGIEGMLDLVDEKKRSNDTEINQMWGFIKPNYEINDEDSGITLYGDYQEEIILEDEYSVAMNWGYVSVACNNIFYTLRVGSTSLTPSWRVGDNTHDTVRKIYYNIRQ
mgnify:CR=1 FL=1